MLKKFYYPAAAVAVFSFVFWLLPPYFDGSEALRNAALGTRDVFFKIRQISSEPPAAIQNIVIVTIDEASSEKLQHRWPWPRTVFASMIDELREKGAKAVGFNLSFTGLEGGSEESTQILADAMKRHGNVVVGSTFGNDGRLIRPSPLLAGAVSRYGYLEKIVDPDFEIRRSYLLRLYSQSKRQASSQAIFENSFPLQMLAAASGPEREHSAEYDADLGLLTVGTPHKGIYLNSDGSYVVNYLAAESDFMSIPAWKVAEGKFRAEDVRDKVVLIGLTSPLFSDKHPTPLGIMSGIAIHANEYLAAQAGRMLRFVPEPVVFFLSWLIALCVFLLFLSKRFWLGFIGFIVAAGGLFLGAQAAFAKDYVIEPFILFSGPLAALVFGVIAVSLKLLLENRGLETKVIHDKMTGLYTYEYLRMRLDDEWQRSRKLKTPVSIVMTDLDRFKKINDTLGHEVGNEMIKRTAAVIKESARGYDVVSRYGGDEFVILLWHASKKDAQDYRLRLRDQYHAMAKKLEGSLQDSSISIGIATFDPAVDPKFPSNAQALVEIADKDLFEDKNSRR